MSLCRARARKRSARPLQLLEVNLPAAAEGICAKKCTGSHLRSPSDDDCTKLRSKLAPDARAEEGTSSAPLRRPSQMLLSSERRNDQPGKPNTQNYCPIKKITAGLSVTCRQALGLQISEGQTRLRLPPSTCAYLASCWVQLLTLSGGLPASSEGLRWPAPAMLLSREA